MPKPKENSYRKYLEQRHESFQTPDDLINSMVEKAIGTGIVEKRKIIEGEVNEVYDVSTNRGSVIVRISRLGRSSFETEEKIIRLVSLAGVPAPKVLLIDDSPDSGQDLTFCIEEKIEGQQLKDLMRFRDKDSLRKLLGESAKILSIIHQIPVNKFGPINSEKYFETWADFVYQFEPKRNKIVKVGKKIGLASNDIDRAFKIQSDHRNLFQLENPMLLHGDFSPKHILVKDNGITGVIDFEDAKGGDPIRDIAWLDFFYHNAFPIEWFTDGYTNRELFDKNFDIKMKLYKLNLGLDLVNYFSDEKNLPGMLYAKGRLTAELANF